MRLTEGQIRQIVRGTLRESEGSDESTALQLLGGGQLKGKLEGVVDVFIRSLSSKIAETPEAQEILSSYAGPNYTDDEDEVSERMASVFMAADDLIGVVQEYMRERRITQTLHKIIARVAPEVAEILPHHALEHVVSQFVTDLILEIPVSAYIQATYPYDTPLMQVLLSIIDSSARAHAASQTDPERAQIAKDRDAQWWAEQGG